MPSAEANASTEIQMHCHDNNKCSVILILAFYVIRFPDEAGRQ